MSMNAFAKMGFTWIVRKYEIEYRSGILPGDEARVRTWISKIGKLYVDVAFEIESKKKQKNAASGIARYVLIDTRTGKPVNIPRNAVESFSI